MIKDKYKGYLHWGVTIFLIILCSMVAFFVVWRYDDVSAMINSLSNIFAPIITGMIIAYLLGPVALWFEKLLNKIPTKTNKTRTRVTRGVSILFALIVFLSVISFVVGSLLPQTISAMRVLVFNLDTYVQTAEQLIEPLLDLNPVIREWFGGVLLQAEQYLNDFVQNDLMKLMGTLTIGVLEIGRFIYNFVIGLIVSIYMMAAHDILVGRSKKMLYAFIRLDRADQVLDVARQTNRMFRGFIVGKLVDSSIIGVLCFLGLTALSMPYTLLISVIVGVTNIIPYFGPFIGAIPSALLILLIDPIKCLIFIVFILVLQQIDGNFIGPKILGNTTGLSSLGVLFSILVGGGLFGIVGMVVSVPICGVLYTLFKRLTDRRLRMRGMPTNTDIYVDVENPGTLASKETTT